MTSESKKRPGSDSERPPKRPKATNLLEPSTNPYLAHIYDNSKQSANGIALGKRESNDGETVLHSFKRHNTTADQAMKAEDGPYNPFNGKPLSNQYFRILETRRNLPVHQQR